MWKKNVRRTLLATALAGLIGATGTGFAQLSSDRTGANPGDQIRLNLVLPAARGDSLYLAAVLGSSIYFFDESGDVSAYTPGKATPRRRAGGAAGAQTVLEFALPEGIDAAATFYAGFGQSGVDILATPGALDATSLRSLPLDLTPVPGGPAYAANCQSCHDYDPAANINNIQNGKDAAKIKAAIAGNKGGMGQLSYLSARQIEAISYWIQSPRFDCH